MDYVPVKTYVKDLDDKLQGGIPKGHLVLVAGGPGTLKSCMSYSILYNNALHEGKNCIYLSLEQTEPSLRFQMDRMGFTSDTMAHLDILDMAYIRKEIGDDRSRQWIDILKFAVEELAKRHESELLVVDSLGAMEVVLQFQNPRKDLFEMFEWVRDLGLTSFMITEASPNNEGYGRYDADFLSDGIISLTMHELAEVDVQRRLRVVKLRGIHHATNYFLLEFENGAFRVRPVLVE